MKEAKLLKYSKKVLVAAVNIARRKQLVGEGGQKWEQFLAVCQTPPGRDALLPNAAVCTFIKLCSLCTPSTGCLRSAQPFSVLLCLLLLLLPFVLPSRLLLLLLLLTVAHIPLLLNYE